MRWHEIQRVVTVTLLLALYGAMATLVIKFLLDLILQ